MASEWAARCPACLRPLDDSVAPSSAELRASTVRGPSPEARPTTGRSRAAVRRGPRRTVLAAVAAALVAGLSIGAAVVDSSGNGARSDQLPAGLRAERLALLGSAGLGVYTAAGKVIKSFPSSVSGDPVPIVTGDGAIVYVAGAFAYRTSAGGRAPPVRIGAATSAFPEPARAVGLQDVASDGTSAVRTLTADGRLAAPEPLQLPPGTTVVARLPAGLLAETSVLAAAPVPTLRLSLYGDHGERTVATVSAVVAASGDTIATATCPSGSYNCSLETVNLASGRVQPVPPPLGFVGYTPVSGALSPNGRLLAAFVSTAGDSGNSELRASVINLDTATAVVSGPAIALGRVGAQMAWSRDGKWLFYSVSGGALFAQQTSASAPVGRSWPLPLPATGQVAGL